MDIHHIESFQFLFGTSGGSSISQRVRQLPRGCANLLFCKNVFLRKKTAWKWKNLGQEGARFPGAPLDPPLGTTLWCSDYLREWLWTELFHLDLAKRQNQIVWQWRVQDFLSIWSRIPLDPAMMGVSWSKVGCERFV